MKTAKQVTLVSNNPQISEIKIHKVGKSLTKMSKMKIIDLYWKRLESVDKREILLLKQNVTNLQNK